MHTYFDRHSLGRRTVAIVAAYIIAVSTVVASFASARASVEAIAAGSLDPGYVGVICHTEDGRAPSSPDNQDSNRHCIDNCCNGCLALAAVLPPRSAALNRAPPLVLSAASFTAVVFTGRPCSKAHRSRAPPLTA